MKISKIFTLIIFLFFFTTIFGQKNAYHDLRKTYQSRDFKFLQDKPKYKPVEAACKNFLLPGLGHYYLNEPKLGSLYLTSGLIIDGSALMSIALIVNGLTQDKPYTTTEYMSDADVLALFGLIYLYSWPLLTLSFRTFSAISTMKIAKVKSVAFEDKKSNTLSLKLLPVIKYHSFETNNGSMVCGFNLILNF